MAAPITAAAREQIERLSAKALEEIQVNPESRQEVLTRTLGRALEEVLDALEEIEESTGA